MGRRSHGRSLSVWTNGVRVGRWTIPARGMMALQYDADWVAADIGRPLSLSLPFNLQNLPVKGEKLAHYFDNLLPDSDAIRRRVAERFRTGSTEPFDLLKAIGRDCVGAVQILGEDEVPTDHGIQRRHFNSTARNVGYASTAEPIIEALLARTPAAIAEVQAELPADFSPRVRDAILGGLQRAAKALGAMPP